MGLIPSSRIEKLWRDALSRIEFGTLDFIAPNGELISITGSKEGPRARFAIHDWDVLKRAGARGDIGLGEDYIAGAWDTDDVEKLGSLFLMNMDRLENFAMGNFVNRLLFQAHNKLVRRNSLSGSRRNIQDHYDVGNDFYALWLDRSMTYSSALFGDEEANLEQGQRNKYERILSRFQKHASSVLEIGCGWGGFAERAAQESHHVTGLTISPAQHRFASERLKGAADIKLEDYRESRGLFDMIVSIEMFEAVGEQYWPQYFQTVAQRLKQGGRAVIQTITIRDDLFAGYRASSDFIRHYVFPGGMLPSLQQFREEAERAGLRIAGVFSFGTDYARTLREWSSRMQARRADIAALGHDERFLRNWQFYLGICAATFAVEHTDVSQVELVHT